ncbi:sigma 54-interacting transcriptional regulator [Petrotoga sp. Shatin.DS.tank11.9.2.9.3]|uniref:sigma 54-interacting transcriptional regulator n=1 Tax=Petrotoga sp. Shatin.DS.tank11.9.2.9.3 TaxID=1469556 RepID=UPI000EF28BF0|nr:sigma 54-interacting transcriptional regulator [Petrotoga sp. Shatin.DS.tank11.9.2.9.3]
MIYIEDSSIIEDIIDSLQKQFDEKKEKVNVKTLFTNKMSSDVTLSVVDQDFLQKNQIDSKCSFIILVDDYVKPQVFDLFLQYEIIGIFRKSRLKFELEEKGKLEKLLKEEIRKLKKNYQEDNDFNEITRKIPYKNIKNWKFRSSVKSKEELEDFYKKKKYISIFLDPSMRDFYHKLKIIIDDIVNSFEKYFEDIKNVMNEIKYIDKDLSRFDNYLLENLKDTYKLPTILIEGETGTGKSLITNIIYDAVKKRVDDDRIKYYQFSLVNMEQNLIDSELFGTRKGAFTNADNRGGRLMENIFGFVFLDEIAEIPFSTQAKLLLYLDEYKITPEGYDKEAIPVPTFLMAATNKNLISEIQKGNFRSDLYYRFKYKISIPSVRERKEDLRFLISFILQSPFINYVDDNLNYAVDKISLEAIEKLENYSYPGNFRELESILKAAVNDCVIKKQSIILPENIRGI